LADRDQKTNGNLSSASGSSALKPIFTVTSNINEVEPTWRELERFGIVSPGQSFDFVRNWISALDLPTNEQFYVIAYVNKRPVALLPLHRTTKFFSSVLTFFVGTHVACNGALINPELMAELSQNQRKTFWREMLRALPPADVVYLPSLPTGEGTLFESFEGLGKKPVCDYVYRAAFDSWAEIDAKQRDRKRRKRDKQHRHKLDALGEVTLKRIEEKADARAILDEVFEQKARRFEQLGIDDPFADEQVRDFYRNSFDAKGDAKPVIYALYLNEKMVGARYCVQQGEKLFMLISSMSDDEEIMPGSPGHQCLLETFKVAYDRDGVGFVDIGVGESDEKRRWCNQLVPVCTKFLPRTPMGWSFFVLQTSIEKLKCAVKTSPKFFEFYKSIRGFLPAALRT
jgi:CelD/BcsL family acetyltransferase involved in cellulose biosynthesis